VTGIADRRPAPAVAALVLAVSLLVALGAGDAGYLADAATAQGKKRPNIVVVMTDDQRQDDLQVMNRVRTRLVDKGVTFDNYYATFPLCCPSRVSFLTGQYPHNHGIVSNLPPDGGFQAFGNDEATLPVALRQAGYRTGFVGKYLNGYGSSTRDASYVPPGWKEWYGSLKNRMIDFSMNQNGDRVGYHGRLAYATDVEARLAKSFIRRSAPRKKPFFLTLATRAPHVETGVDAKLDPRPAPRHRGTFRGIQLPSSPSINEANVGDKPSFVPNEPLSDERLERLRLQHRARRESMLAVDDAVGAVIRQLRRSEEMAKTWIFLVSDNGYLLGEHRLDSKTRFYEEAASVPLIVRGPGVEDGGKRHQIVGNVDLAPTILELAKAVPAVGMAIDGRSLLPQIADPDAEDDRDILLELRNDQAVRDGNWVWAEYETDPSEAGPDEFELYNLADDEHQLENLYEQSLLPGPLQDRRETLEERLDEIRDCAGAACP
jgi:N-acetylglucosamine-6-sulfatase